MQHSVTVTALTGEGEEFESVTKDVNLLSFVQDATTNLRYRFDCQLKQPRSAPLLTVDIF